MKKSQYIILGLLLFTISCAHEKGKADGKYFIEKELSFFDPYEIVYADGKYQGETYNKWVRQPENLNMLHETFKKIGYRKLFSEYDYSNWCGFHFDINKPRKELIDSLIITYSSDTTNSKYYREFWDRRKVEENDSTVFRIINEISNIVYGNIEASVNYNLVNDTLFQLLNIREFEESITDETARENFDYLKNIGLHRSAYNLLFERYRYYDVNWDQEELAESLKTDSTNCCPQAFIKDDTK